MRYEVLKLVGFLVAGTQCMYFVQEQEVMRNEPDGGEYKRRDGGRIMIENIERIVLFSLFTAVCDRPLPLGGFSGKLTCFYL